MTDSRSPEAIEDEIELTRSRIESRLETLSQNVSPGNLIARAFGADSRSLPDTLNAAMDVARTNPIAACLTAAGIVGLIAGGARNVDPDRGQYSRSRVEGDPARRIGENAAALKARATAAAENVQETAAHLTDAVNQSASSASEAVSDAAAGASEYVREAANTIAEGTSRTYEKVESSTKALGKQVRSAPVRARAGGEYAVAWVKENPVAAGLLAIAAGAVTSSIFAARRSTSPTSRPEAGRELYEAALEKETKVGAGRRDEQRPLPAAATKPQSSQQADRPAGVSNTVTSDATTPTGAGSGTADRQPPTRVPPTAGSTVTRQPVVPSETTVNQQTGDSSSPDNRRSGAQTIFQPNATSGKRTGQADKSSTPTNKS